MPARAPLPTRCRGGAGPFRWLLLACALLVFTDMFGYSIVVPLLPFFARRRGAPIAVVGAIFATYSLCQLLAAPALGALSDRIGRRPVLLLSQAGSAAGFLLLAVSTSLVPVFISRVVDGATAANIGTINAVALDTADRREWAGRFAILGAATGAGLVAGLATSSLLAPRGLAAGALAALALALLSMAVTTLAIPETRREPGSHAGGLGRLDAAQRRGLRIVLSGAFISMMAQAAFLVTLPLYLLATLRYTAQQASIFLTALVGGAAFFQLLGLRPLLRKLRERRACLVGFGLVSIGGVVCAVAGTLPVVAVGAALAVAGVVTLNPAYTSLIGSVSKVDQGTLMGVNQSIASAGQMIGPLFGYGALALAGAGGYGWLCVFLALAGAAVTLRLRDKADV